jgi:predicted DsbA family dithiol-disulfide isomerase
VHIDIWSDVICPWCYLGKRRFDKAVATLSWADEIHVRWRAYQLDPQAPLEPGDLRAALERKYGPGAFERMTERMTSLGQAEGVNYRFDVAQRVNTLDAHRLLAWAWDMSGASAQDRLQQRLFRAYFEDGEDVADRDALVRFAGDAGLDVTDARRIATSQAYANEVADDLRSAMDRQLAGVPAFVIEDQWLIPGAQDVETIRVVLERARERLVVVPTTLASGGVCAVDDPAC